MYTLNLFLLLLWVVHSQQKTKVTILYESLCPDSETPLRNLQEGIGDFHNKQNEVDLELVPYGKANHTFSNGKWEIDCDHGQEECVFNKYHACGLKYSADQIVQLGFVSCMITYVRKIMNEAHVRNCTDYARLDYGKIHRCYHSDESTALLVAYGERTKPFKPLREVPTILYNDTFYEDLQEEAKRDPIGTISKITGDDSEEENETDDNCCCCDCCC